MYLANYVGAPFLRAGVKRDGRWSSESHAGGTHEKIDHILPDSSRKGSPRARYRLSLRYRDISMRLSPLRSEANDFSFLARTVREGTETQNT
jgi:hypothetical protein